MFKTYTFTTDNTLLIDEHQGFSILAITSQGPVPRYECELHAGHPHDGHLLLCLRVDETADGAQNKFENIRLTLCGISYFHLLQN